MGIDVMQDVPRVGEVDGLLEIGKDYLVPCASLFMLGLKSPQRRYRWMPILDEHVGDISRERHRHIDIRFLTQYELRIMRPQRTKVRSIIACASNNFPLEYKSKTCLRHFPTCYVPTDVPNFDKLQKMMKNTKLNTSTMICPHQGYNLKQVKPRKDCVVCPVHFLAWSPKNGELMDRKK